MIRFSTSLDAEYIGSRQHRTLSYGTSIAMASSLNNTVNSLFVAPDKFWGVAKRVPTGMRNLHEFLQSPFKWYPLTLQATQEEWIGLPSQSEADSSVENTIIG